MIHPAVRYGSYIVVRVFYLRLILSSSLSRRRWCCNRTPIIVKFLLVGWCLCFFPLVLRDFHVKSHVFFRFDFFIFIIIRHHLQHVVAGTWLSEVEVPSLGSLWVRLLLAGSLARNNKKNLRTQKEGIVINAARRPKDQGSTIGQTGRVVGVYGQQGWVRSHVKKELAFGKNHTSNYDFYGSSTLHTSQIDDG